MPSGGFVSRRIKFVLAINVDHFYQIILDSDRRFRGR